MPNDTASRCRDEPARQAVPYRMKTRFRSPAGISPHNRPVGMVAFSPWTDLALPGRSSEERATADPIFFRD
jgi:hypothetical protein